MIISREYEISPKTSLSNKEIDIVKIAKGSLRKVSFQSAPGVNGEIYIRILHLENSIIPDETGEWIPLTGTRQEYQLEFSDWHDIHCITIEICAPDTRFTHKINVEIDILEQETLEVLFESFVQGGLKSQIQ